MKEVLKTGDDGKMLQLKNCPQFSICLKYNTANCILCSCIKVCLSLGLVCVMGSQTAKRKRSGFNL